MRLCVGASALPLLPFLFLWTMIGISADQDPSKERHFYIAAVEIDWNYHGHNTGGSHRTYKKVVFREYEKGFQRAKPHPSSLGLLGPTLRAEEGETIVVTFRNMATEPYSIHPHGIAYGKHSEGARYFDNTSLKEKEDDVVKPNCEHVYDWEVTPNESPQPNDPACLTYSYVSHWKVVEDYNAGLIGALLVCKPGSLNDSHHQLGIDQELVLLFGVFDEEASNYKTDSKVPGDHVKYTINGYAEGSLPDISMCAYSSVSLHLLGMSSQPEVFSVHMNGHVLEQLGHRVTSVGLISGSCSTASLALVNTGRWLLSSQVFKHIDAGMYGFVDVDVCPSFKAPRQRITYAQKQESKLWTYYITAEEKIWNYAPSRHEDIDETYNSQFLRQSPTRIGGSYRKALYTQYTNESFTEQSIDRQRRKELGILGPVIRAQVLDTIKIVFKNMASRPYSIYPHGLTIKKSDEGVNYPAGGNQSHAVQPGETHTYEWNVREEDGPMEEDSRCLTRLYHSAVDTPRDIASGLLGPILICKRQSLNPKNVQWKADKEQHIVFSVFDENKSWYLDENIKQNCDPSRVDKADPDFYKSNVMHTINGYVYHTGPTLGFCNGEVPTWHMSSIGAQDSIQTATVYGHPFNLNGRTEDSLSLYPMTGETIKVTMENIGVWLLTSMNIQEANKGMQIKFQDVECFRENYIWDEFSEWKPDSLEDIEREEERKLKSQSTPKPDILSDMWAAELGIRSHKGQSDASSYEKLDLSFLDHDAIDVVETVITLPVDSDSTVEPKNRDQTSVPRQDVLDGKDVHRLNPTAATMQHQKATHAKSSFPSSPSHNSSMLISKNTKKEEQRVAPKNDNGTLNRTMSSVLSNLYKLIFGNVSKETTNQNATLSVDGIVTGALSEFFKSLMKAQGLHVTQTPEEKPLRGDVFSHSETPSHSTDTLIGTSKNNVTSPPCSTKKKDMNNTVTNHAWPLTDGRNRSLSTQTVDVGKSNISCSGKQNSTTFGLKNAGNTSNTSDPLEIVSGTDSPKSLFADGSPQPHNGPTQSVNIGINKTTLSGNGSFESYLTPSVVAPSNATRISGNMSVSSHSDANMNSEEFGATESDEEIFIYLKANKTDAIKSTSVKTKPQNWKYDTTHQTVQSEIPDHIMKYIGTQGASKPKKGRRITFRERPKKGLGMKTKKKKEYKPNHVTALPFSPRGFNPAMSPRGLSPVSLQTASDEEELLINQPVVIGVPRSDFRDYELYVPGIEPQFMGSESVDENLEDYEFVSYKEPYSSLEKIPDFNMDTMTKYHMKQFGPNVRMYFIAAVEVEWNYAGYGRRRQDTIEQNRQETKFTKAVFLSYEDSSFKTPHIRGEIDEHLGILGPVIKAEVGQTIVVLFKNMASRAYSLHPSGASYTKSTEGLSYEDDSKYWYKYDNEVLPNATFTYVWKTPEKVGPTPSESDCRTWAYFSGVNPERDLHTGLIGPLLVCRKGTLNKNLTNTREFTLMFMIFDESKSWYYEKNREVMQRKSRRKTLDPNLNLKFHSINGIIYNLKGLRMYKDQLVCWHLINMGSSKDIQSVHFHGQTFLHKKTSSYRESVFPLLPGTFATLEMHPSKPGLWQLETEIGYNQQMGMQTLLLVLDDDCYRPLGLQSGSVKDSQITSNSHRGEWKPFLARLNNPGKYNAWSTDQNHSWIQVDFQRPIVISQIATQGAKQFIYSQYVRSYGISYSNDRRVWTYYKGDSLFHNKVFPGNQEAYEIKINTFFPPIIARFMRLHPILWYDKATVRMEYYGCELDGCSVPLGMENGLIEDHHITASSTAHSWYSGEWKASLARLNKQGTINAWQAKNNDMSQWLQVELPEIKKVTGIVTQGAKALGAEMYVITFTLQYSNDGVTWNHYTDDECCSSKLFGGNTDNNKHVKNYIYPPIFARFIRIHPVSWRGSITMRVELLGCDFD